MGFDQAFNTLLDKKILFSIKRQKVIKIYKRVYGTFFCLLSNSVTFPQILSKIGENHRKEVEWR